MNEHQVENLLSQHGDEILRRQRVRQMKASPKRWKPLLVTGTTAVCVLALALALPRNADAARVQRMGSALKGVKSMEYWGYIRTNGQAWNLVVHTINQNGLIRQEVAKSRAQKVTFITNQGHHLMNYERLPFATLSESDEQSTDAEGPTDPLKIAITNLAGDPKAEQYSVTSHESAPLNGRSTYTLSYKSKERPGPATDPPQSQEFQIVVDEATNLPIESTHHSVYKGSESDSKYQYVYDRQYNESIFSLDPHKPVINAALERKKLIEQWSKVQMGEKQAPIYSATVSPEGTIWIAFGVSDWQNMGSVPSSIETSNGIKYVKGTDRITSWQQGNKSFLVGGKEVVISPFIPLADQTALPTSARLAYGSRKPDDHSVQEVEAKFTNVSLTPESWNIPHYFPAVSYGRDMLSFPTEFWRIRAEGLRDQGDILSAAKAYEIQAEKCKGFVEYIGYKSLLEAAKCYDTLGNPDKAKALRARAEDLQRTRIR